MLDGFKGWRDEMREEKLEHDIERWGKMQSQINWDAKWGKDEWKRLAKRIIK